MDVSLLQFCWSFCLKKKSKTNGAVDKNLPADSGDTGLIPVQEDSTCGGAIKPRHHNWWSSCAQSLCSGTRETTARRSPHNAIKSSPWLPQLEKAPMQQQRPRVNKIKLTILKKLKDILKKYFEIILVGLWLEVKVPVCLTSTHCSKHLSRNSNQYSSYTWSILI